MVEKIIVKDISKSFKVSPKSDERMQVLKDVNFTVNKGEFLVLFGPGQIGKSTLMEIIAGLIKQDTGTVTDQNGETLKIKDISMVFQKYALFPWKTVLQNVALPLKYKNVPKAKREEIAKKYIKLVGLDGFEKSYERELSGGMKQRVAIARAYAKECDVLLCDEPFGALDAQTRYKMEDELMNIWQEYKKTVIFITNNIEEAVYLADRILVLDNKPANIVNEYDIPFDRPRDRSNLDFIKMRKTIEENVTYTKTSK